MSDPSGLVVVDKPGGLTSHGVVARLRRLAGTRKVGHAGTLDPMATGVLVAGIGRATRLLGHLTLTEKAYDATVRLGAVTSTDDAEGEVLTTAPTSGVTDDAVREALRAFVGTIEQRPSAVSAVKVDGRRAYQRVRAGEDVVLPARTVTVHSLDVHDVLRPGGPDGPLDVRLSLRCSSGTYVRAVARDLGETLGVGGHLTALRRTAVGPFGLDAARTLEQLEDRWQTLPMPEVARRCFPVVELDDDGAREVGFGRRLPGLPLAGTTALLGPDGRFLALYGPDGEGARAVAVLEPAGS